MTGTSINAFDNGIKSLLCQCAEVSSLGKVVADETIGLFTESTFPGMVGPSTVHHDLYGLCNPLMECNLTAIVMSHRTPELERERSEDASCCPEELSRRLIPQENSTGVA